MTYTIHTIEEDLENTGFGFEDGYPKVKTFHNDEYIIVECGNGESIQITKKQAKELAKIIKRWKTVDKETRSKLGYSRIGMNNV